MPLDFSAFADTPRLLIEAKLRPVQGERFQPTGFPNLGAATYKAPDGSDMLLVESAQSMANRLEGPPCWDETSDNWAAPLGGTPLIKVLDSNGKTLTNSVLESHRLNSAYILDGTNLNGVTGRTFVEVVEQALNYITPNGPVISRELAKFIFSYCPNTLLHGVFFANSTHNKRIGNGRLRLPRLLSGFIEAKGAAVAASGGAKIDRVDASGKSDGGSAETGYGNVPYARDEYTAKEIRTYFNLDLAQLRAFGLGSKSEEFLIALSLFQILKFLAEGLRLRTACDLELIPPVDVTRPKGLTVPELAALEEALPNLISAVVAEGRFANPPVTTITWQPATRRVRRGNEPAAS